MPYFQETLSTLTDELAAALGDPSKVFWTDSELQRLVTESLQTWNCYTAYFRQRTQFNTNSTDRFYDLISQGIVSQVLNLNEVFRDVQYSIMEPVANFSIYNYTTFPTTAMYSAQQINDAIYQALAQFQRDTGAICTIEAPVNIPVPPNYTVELNQEITDIRFAYIRRIVTGATYDRFTLRRQDEFDSIGFGSPLALIDEGVPYAYSWISPHTQPAIRLIPMSFVSGFVESISIRSTSLPPVDWQWAIKWLAISFLLSMDSQSRDHFRAEYARKRYMDSLQLAKISPSVLGAYINWRSCPIHSLMDMSSYQSQWLNQTGSPTGITMFGWNILALDKIDSTAIYDLSFDTVVAAPVSIGANIQLAQEHKQAILNYAKHIACFKMGGQEFISTQSLYEDFFNSAMSYNSRLKAESPNFEIMKARAKMLPEQKYTRRVVGGE